MNSNKTLEESIYAMLQKYLLIAGKVTFMQCSHIFVSVFLAEFVIFVLSKLVERKKLYP